MGTIKDFLGTDHRACDALFASAEEAVGHKNWSDAHALFEQFQNALSHHLAMEENVLFPAFESRTGMTGGPTQVMRMEHDQMRGLIQDMAHAFTRFDDAAYLGLSETLNMLMQQHNLKEETMLYPMSDQVLGAERDKLIGAMQAIAP